MVGNKVLSKQISSSNQENNIFFYTRPIFVLFVGIVGYVLGLNHQIKSVIQDQNKRIDVQIQPTAVPIKPKTDDFPQFVDCHFDSQWFGFEFDYILKKLSVGDSCYVKRFDDDLTSYSWPTGPDGIIFYRRNNLFGKAWWRKHITNEAGYLDESKYTFKFSKTKNGIDKMEVFIDNSKLDESVDRVGVGWLRGSTYYFGKEWVIRVKIESTGGPYPYQTVEDSLRLIPIEKKKLDL